MSKKQKVLNALMRGEQITAKQISNRFGLSNPHEAIRSLRAEGFSIYANARSNSKGDVKSFYRLGTPTRAVVAAGYAARGA